MKLFVGLGNPGQRYAWNRHNVGFMAVDTIARAQDFGPWKERYSGLVADGTISGTRVLALKPQTYMNESGRSVAAAARYLKIAPQDVFVFYDEIDLAPGKLKVKTGGGNAGHNGLRSISSHLGNDYVRIRFGIGHPGAKDQVANYVLSNFAKSDAAWLEPLLAAIAESAPQLAKGDAARFLSLVSRNLRSESEGAPAPRYSARQDTVPPPSHDVPPRPPAREGRGKRALALAENLKQWLAKHKITG